MKKLQPIIFTFFLLLIATAISSCGYNTLQGQDEEIKATWSEVLNQYKRRADLVPNLVNVVKGYAGHEKEVLENVTQARSKVASFTVTEEVLKNEVLLKKFQETQSQMSSALSRLLAVSENYPQLKADGSFRDLQAQLEGTENRITVARQRYINAVKSFNTTIRSFPSNLTAKYFGYEIKPNFTVENEAQVSTPPTVSFQK